MGQALGGVQYGSQAQFYNSTVECTLLFPCWRTSVIGLLTTKQPTQGYLPGVRRFLSHLEARSADTAPPRQGPWRNVFEPTDRGKSDLYIVSHHTDRRGSKPAEHDKLAFMQLSPSLRGPARVKLARAWRGKVSFPRHCCIVNKSCYMD